ncbi:MAG TPA: cyclase family protein [Gemmataceae bacterium]|jgi:kynurenine formamidase|nr:cyclase family protein [Gemmataceae bacterium]
MRLIDLSQPVYDGSPNCPVHPPVKSELLRDHPEAGWRVELLTLSNHTGSHVDAPLHKIAGGANLDDMPLETFVGPARIVDLRGIGPSQPITMAMLQAKLPVTIADEIILLATGWGDRRAKTDEWLYRSPYLDPDAATWLVEKKIRGVGIDHYSIGGISDPINPRTHTALLGAGVWIVEELKFPDEAFAVPAPFTFMCLPVNLKGHTGAFCRPVIVLPS